MMRRVFACAVALIVATASQWSFGQTYYQLPDVRTLKHLTTSNSDHAPDIPGKETTMDYYSAQEGQVVTVYSYRGRPIAFSTHSNSDIQKTYRIFLDPAGDARFIEINRGSWQIPAWAR